MKSEYASALRINSANVCDLEKNLDKYKGCFDEVFFFSQSTHSVRGLEYHKNEAEKLKPYVDMVKKKGLRAGINVLDTIGFFREALDDSMENAKVYCYQNGAEALGRLCPCDRDNIDFYKEQYRIYARLFPDIIYIDDDISSLACACDDCIKRFALLNPDIVNSGLGRDEFLSLLNNDDINTRERIRIAWIRFNSLRMEELFKNIEAAVHEVDPKIKLGAMTYMSGSDGLDTDVWAAALSSETTPEIYWRPGGGVYTDDSMSGMCDKANRISAQLRYLPEFAEPVESEIESFPYQSLEKSPSFTAFESFVYQAAGCTGTAYNVLSKEEKIGEEHEVFFKLAKDAREYGTQLTATFGRSPLSGVGFWWDKTSASFPCDIPWSEGKPVLSAEDIHRIGIPYACDPEHMSVFFLNADTAVHIPDDELKKCLSKGVMLDGGALNVINKRGYGEYIGFEVIGEFHEDTLEQEIKHSLNMPGLHRRNIRQAFDCFGAGTSYTVEKTMPGGEYLAENRDLYENLRGMSAGIFENKLGGRVCVEGITPFGRCFSMPRSIHVKNVMRWLSKDTLPVFLQSFHRISLWSRGQAVFAANTATELAENVCLQIKTNSQKAYVTTTCGSKIVKKETVFSSKTENGYAEFVIPRIDVTGTALITL